MDDDPGWDDPGWDVLRQHPGSLLLPQLAMRRARSLGDRLSAMRLVFASFGGLAVIGTIIGVALGSIEGTAPIGELVATGSVVVIAVLSVVRRLGRNRAGVGCGTPDEVADDYYVRFLKEMALVAFISPWSVLASFLSLSILPALVGLVGTAAAMVVVAPTADQVERDREALAESGCGVDLRAALSGG